MKRVLLICLSLVLALGGWSAAFAEDGFYVIPSMKVVPKTGQTETYGTRDDGALQKGVAWPTPRFTDNNNGTVTDNLTRLIWMKDALALSLKTWDAALSAANSLASDSAGLTDGSQAGDWRLPNVRELQSLIDYGMENPALPADNPFINLQTGTYFWSSTTYNFRGFLYPYGVRFGDGAVNYLDANVGRLVLCVRGGP